MTRVPKGYNGLRPIGGGQNVPMLGQSLTREGQAERAIALEMQAIMREIYVRVASDMIDRTTGDFAAIAHNCQLAAQAYFVGLGVITIEEPRPGPEELQPGNDDPGPRELPPDGQ